MKRLLWYTLRETGDFDSNYQTVQLTLGKIN